MRIRYLASQHFQNRATKTPYISSLSIHSFRINDLRKCYIQVRNLIKFKDGLCKFQNIILWVSFDLHLQQHSFYVAFGAQGGAWWTRGDEDQKAWESWDIMLSVILFDFCFWACSIIVIILWLLRQWISYMLWSLLLRMVSQVVFINQLKTRTFA